MAGTGTEQTRFHSGKQGVTIPCDAECDAISGDRVEVLARAVKDANPNASDTPINKLSLALLHLTVRAGPFARQLV